MSAEKSQSKVKFLDNINFLIENSTEVKSKRSLAISIGVSNVAFTNMSKRGTAPSLDLADKCAKYFGVSLDDIVYKDLSSEMNKKKITVPLYTLSNLKEPCNTVHISMEIKPNSFALLVTEKESSLYAGDIFIISKGEKIKNYDYVLISFAKKNYIKQIRYRNLDVYFTDIDKGEKYERFEQYQILGVITSKIIN